MIMKFMAVIKDSATSGGKFLLKKSLTFVIDNTDHFNDLVENDDEVHATDVLMIIMTLILQIMLMMMFKFICLDRAQMLVMCAGANLTSF